MIPSMALMEEDGEKLGCANESDLISNLTEPLLNQVLSNLPTNEVVKTSLLSTAWRNLWKHVSTLELDNNIGFTDYTRFVTFVDTFLDFNTYLEKFKLKYDCDGDYEPEIALISRWINIIVTSGKGIKHIDVLDDSNASWDIEMPLTLYTCESLVSLKLCALTLPSPDFVSLPCLKVLDLTIVKFGEDLLTLETLISRCPVLECLAIERSFCDDIQVLRVRSQSLLSFTHAADGSEGLVEDLAVVVDAPKLEYLRLSDCRTATFILNNSTSLVEVDIDTMFNLSFVNKFDSNDLPKRSMIRNFLLGISGVKHMVVASSTLEVIYSYSRCEPLPLFRNLSSLRVEFDDYSWEMLPIFLERCPKLRSLVVGSTRYLARERIDFSSGPRCSLASLEYVEIERPLKGEVMEMKLVAYLLEKSTILKKLTLCVDDSRKKEESAILKELLTITRSSTSCQVDVL